MTKKNLDNKQNKTQTIGKKGTIRHKKNTHKS